MEPGQYRNAVRRVARVSGNVGDRECGASPQSGSATHPLVVVRTNKALCAEVLASLLSDEGISTNFLANPIAMRQTPLDSSIATENFS
jgi:hypothetical protein